MGKRKIGIIGFGKTGKALLSFFRNDPNVSDIIIFDDKDPDLSGITYDQDSTEFVTGIEGIKKLAGSDIVIISPGVNGREERFLYLKEAGVRIVSEIEFASSFIDSGIIAVTGTNGKSTTVSLIHHLLSNSGIDSHLTGNIGVPLISEIGKINDGSKTVLEVSSFQLEEIEDFRPEITLILNITPDHLDRYPELQEYINAKLDILKNLSAEDPVILNYDDPFLRRKFYNKNDGNFKKIWFSTGDTRFEDGAWMSDGNAVVRMDGDEKIVPLDGNPLIGLHNIENILASFLAVSLMGLSSDQMYDALGSFKGLPHRMEICGKKDGVIFINDSKATNIEATVKAISGVESNIALILGGKDKGGDFSVLNKFINKKLKKIILIGEAADSISAGINSEKAFIARVDTLDEAMRKGYEVLAGSGGTVLLAPGCASFDMFKNFEERGNTFKEGVRKFMDEGING